MSVQLLCTYLILYYSSELDSWVFLLCTRNIIVGCSQSNISFYLLFSSFSFYSNISCPTKTNVTKTQNIQHVIIM